MTGRTGGTSRRLRAACCVVLACVAVVACKADMGTNASATATSATAPAQRIAITIASAGGRHVFQAEVASTPAAQQRGLMFRTDIGPADAMLFAPYPAEGGGPREASFWMRDTPTALDIIFIRPDGTIARIAANTIPYDETPVTSGEPVAAVLEILGGRAGELGIVEGDRVTWPKAAGE